MRRTGSRMQNGMLWHLVASQRHHHRDRWFPAWVDRRMPLLADGRDIRRKNQTIGATFHNSFIGQRWEGYDGFATGEVHPSAEDAASTS